MAWSGLAAQALIMDSPFMSDMLIKSLSSTPSPTQWLPLDMNLSDQNTVGEDCLGYAWSMPGGVAQFAMESSEYSVMSVAWNADNSLVGYLMLGKAVSG
jgi:hypothetical protein